MCARFCHPLAIVPLVLLTALVPTAQAQFTCENCEARLFEMDAPDGMVA